MRLPRSRRGKTPIDVGVVTQESGPRVRLSVGEDGHGQQSYRKNSDLDVKETEDLITMLQYHVAIAKGEIKQPEEG